MNEIASEEVERTIKLNVNYVAHSAAATPRGFLCDVQSGMHGERDFIPDLFAQTLLISEGAARRLQLDFPALIKVAS